jgi:hypothetical protein
MVAFQYQKVSTPRRPAKPAIEIARSLYGNVPSPVASWGRGSPSPTWDNMSAAWSAIRDPDGASADTGAAASTHDPPSTDAAFAAVVANKSEKITVNSIISTGDKVDRAATAGADPTLEELTERFERTPTGTARQRTADRRRDHERDHKTPPSAHSAQQPQS